MATNTEKIVVQVVVQGEKQLDNLNKKTKSTTLGFNKLTAGILGAVAAFNQINKAISTGIRTFRDFEFQMAKVRAVTNSSNKDFNKLESTAKELGRTTFFTAQQVAELQTNFGKLGFTTQEILDAQEATLLLATATDVDLGRAAVVAGAAVRGFNLNATETLRVVDVMAKAFTSSALDIEKFQTSMTKVAPIAASAGISLEATTAVMGVLTDAGIEASIAGTSLRNIFLKMQDPASDLSKFLGFTVHSADDLQLALTKLNEAGLENEDIMKLVDIRQVAAFNRMIEGKDRISELIVSFDNATGSSQKMADIIGDTLEGELKRLTSASQGLAIELVDKLGGGLRNLIKNLTDLLNKLTENSDRVASLVTNLVTAIKWIGLYRLGILGAAKATALFRGAVVLLNGSLNITRAAIAKTGIGLLAVALGTLAEKYLFASDAGDEYNDTQKETNKETEDLIKNLQKELELSQKALESKGKIGLQTQEEIDAQELAAQEKKFQKQQEGLQNNFTEELSLLKNQLINKQITQEEYDELAFTKEQLHLANMLGLYQMYGKSTADINAQILDNELTRINETAEAEARARSQQISDMEDIGKQLIMVGEQEEELIGIKRLGIKVSQAAAVAKNLETLANMTLGVSEQAKLPFPANIVAMASTLATLLSLISNIKSLTSDKFAQGGMVHGKSHAHGGEKFAVGGRVVELEGGEAVINKRSTAMFKNQLSAMNVAGGGVKFADGGLMNMPSFAQSQFNATSQAGMMGAIGQGSKVVVVESDISQVQNTVSVIEAEATF